MNGPEAGVVVGLASVVLGAPFLNFVLVKTRSKVDRDNVLVSGAGSTVKMVKELADELRIEVVRVKGELAEERAVGEQRDARHRQEIAELQRDHRVEMADLRAQRDQMKQMVKRLEERLGGSDVG